MTIPGATEAVTPERCWKPRCLLGWEPCQTEWLSKQLWAVCANCGKRRVFLTTFADTNRMIDRELAIRSLLPKEAGK